MSLKICKIYIYLIHGMQMYYTYSNSSNKNYSIISADKIVMLIAIPHNFYLIN